MARESYSKDADQPLFVTPEDLRRMESVATKGL